ncbi:hypothetical protein BGX34_008810, partial [Mortierella sp. NVP85]
MLAACAALISRVVQLAQDTSSSPSILFGTSALLVAWIYAIGLNYLENQHDSRSSTYIFAFYVVCIIASAINIRTMSDLALAGQPQFTSFCVFFGAIICGFVVEAWPRTPLPSPTSSKAPKDADIMNNNLNVSTAYDRSNLFSRLYFHFLQPIISLGYCRPLQTEDIANMMPGQIKTIHSYESISQAWDRHLQKRKASNRKPSLFWVVLKAGGWSWLPIILFAFTESAMEFLQPVLLDVVLDFVASYSTDQPQPTALGIILAITMFATAIVAAMASGQFFQLGVNLGIRLKTGLMSMIYRKALKLSPEARREATVGEITNHMSVDAERVGNAMQYLMGILTSPFEIAIGIWLLYRKLGLSAFTGIGVVIIILPIQAYMARVMNRAKDKKLDSMDKRIRLLTDVLSGIRAVKLYSWERSFQEQLGRFRIKELKHLGHLGTVTALMMIMYTSLPSLMSLLAFIVYGLVGGPDGTRGTISAQVVFVSITLYGRLAKPIGRLSHILSQAIALHVAVKRIQNFFLQEELDESQVEYQQMEPRGENSTVAIEIQDGVFSWTNLDSTVDKTTTAEPTPVKDQRPTLNNINLRVSRESLTVVMGRVGQGKSSLLSAIIGDMYKRQGAVKIYGSVAYVPQQAWIINATVRDNIIFGKPFDQERYDRVLSASGLLPDLEILAAGDMTEIGERGINLSGGQKQRVSLARAAYQDADVYLLDDPLSAVDAHVDQHLWENLIGPQGMLKAKTRLLITHGIHHLSEVDHILIVRDGSIDERGSYAELMALRGSFSQLIEEYSVNETNKNETADTEAGGSGRNGSPTQDGIVSEKDTAAVSPAKENIDKEDDNADLIMKEEAAEGGVGWRVFKHYAKAATWSYSFLSIVGFILSQATQIGVNVWLQEWASQAGTPDQFSVGVFLGVYAVLVALYVMLDFGVNFIVFVSGGIRASRIIHTTLLDNVIRLPMSFFDTTPVGRIVNRFSSDMDNIDELLPFNISDFYFFATSVLGVLIVLSFSVPIFLALIPFLVVLYLIIQVWYIRSSRSLKRIHSISKSPLYQHFGETLTGVSTIRAMRIHDRFILENAAKSDMSANTHFVYTVASRWLHIRLEMLGAIVVFATSLLAVLGRKTLGPGMAGLALTYALSVTFAITNLVTSFSELQNQLVSVERVREYSIKNQEAPATLPTDAQVPANWPSEGRIVFQRYSTRYRQGMDLVLKKVSFEIQPRERVGVVGRTGAGKSSLTLALFRIIEAANSHWAKASHNGPDSSATLPLPAEASTKEGIDPEFYNKTVDLGDIKIEEDGGSIQIDGIDISTVGLERLRKHLAIIPQDPILFSGTVRDNLDPFNESTDNELWEALERAHLRDYISSLENGLSSEVAQNGENFSVGQRSLICLARALLRKTKILILDEATAAVD